MRGDKKDIYKKVWGVIFILSVSFFITACNISKISKIPSNLIGKAQSKAGENKTDGPHIDDIEWSIEEGVIKGNRTLVLNVTNNSEYTITQFDISFAEKSDITDEEKDDFFDDIINLTGLEDEDEIKRLRDMGVCMHGGTMQILEPGESATNIRCYYFKGSFYMNNINHYKLTTPDIAQIAYIDGDKIRKEYYDFKSQKYSMDDTVEDAYYWTTTELGDKIPKPDAVVIQKDHFDNENHFSFNVYGFMMDDYYEYLKQCKEMGYTLDPLQSDDYSYYYYADNSEGYRIRISYDENNYCMDVEIDAP